MWHPCPLLWPATTAKSLQSCPTPWDPIDGSPPGSPVPGILQARILEWVAISFSNAWKWKVKVKSLSHVRLLVTSWTAAYQAPPSIGFSRQEYWSRVPLPSSFFDLHNPNFLCEATLLFSAMWFWWSWSFLNPRLALIGLSQLEYPHFWSKWLVWNWALKTIIVQVMRGNFARASMKQNLSLFFLDVG